MRRLKEIKRVGDKDQRETSVFIEDSILCGGYWPAIERFCHLLEQTSSTEIPQEW